MSVYFVISAIVVGETSVIRQLHDLIVQDETEYRSDEFRCKEVEVGKEGSSALLYRARRTGYRPASEGTLRSVDAHNILNGREVCEYLYSIADSDQEAWSECEFKGTIVARGTWGKRGSLERVERVFAQKCRELGIDADALFKQLATTEEDGEDPRGPEPERPAAQPAIAAAEFPWDDDDLPF